jgi:hypothetical protein
LEKKPQAGSIVPVFQRYFKVVMSGTRGSRARILRPCMEPARCRAARGEHRAARGEPDADNPRYQGMRHEEYTMELFLAVGLIGAILAGAAGLFEARPSSAASPPPAEMARLEPVRVVGTPFVPNIRPRER